MRAKPESGERARSSHPSRLPRPWRWSKACDHPPWTAGRTSTALAMVLHIALACEQPSPDGRISVGLRQANPRITRGLAAIIERGLAKDPRQRYASAALFAEDLRRHLDDEPLLGVVNRRPLENWLRWRRHHPVVLARAGAVVTAVLGLIAVVISIWLAANRRLIDARNDLEQGEIRLAVSDHRQAARSFDYGLRLLDSGTFVDQLLPGNRETRNRLIDARVRNRRAEMAVELHHLVDRVALTLCDRANDEDCRTEARGSSGGVLAAHVSRSTVA